MKYPIVLIIPVLMLCDYYLTLIGSLLHEKGYGKYVQVEQYELHPRWLKKYEKRKKQTSSDVSDEIQD